MSSLQREHGGDDGDHEDRHANVPQGTRAFVVVRRVPFVR
jgi:hypothetical protein